MFVSLPLARSLSPTLSLSFTLLLLHFGTLEFRSYLDARRPHRLSVPSLSSLLLPRASRFPEEWRDAGQTLEPTGAKAKDGVGRKGTVDASPCTFLFLLLLSLPCRVSRERDKEGRLEDGGDERETDKRVVLILEPLPPSVPPYPGPAPFHYRDEPQSFVRGFRAASRSSPPSPRHLSYFFYSLAVRALSLLPLFSFPRTIIGHWRVTNSS